MTSLEIFHTNVGGLIAPQPHDNLTSLPMVLAWRRQTEGFPAAQMAVISILRITEPIAFLLLFPYVYFMIRDFRIAPSEADILRYLGYLAALFLFCQFIFAVRWGKLADRIGRKPVLLLGQAGTLVLMLLFGFLTTYWMALALRSLMGCLNGNVAVLRTMIGEVATEKRHQPLAFLVMPLFFNLGAVIGPMLGGYFAHPSPNSPYDNPDVVPERKYPYAMSNIVVAMLLWMLMGVGFLFLQETHEYYKYRKDYGVELGDKILGWMGVPTPIRPWNSRHHHSTTNDGNDDVVEDEPRESLPLLLTTAQADDVPPLEDSDSIELYEPQEPPQGPAETLTDHIARTYSHGDDSIALGPPSRRPLYHVDYLNAFTPQVVTIIMGNAIISTHGIIYNEFLPVLLAGQFDPSAIRFPWTVTGGLGWTTDGIGTLLSSTGIMGMVVVVAVFPYITERWGAVRAYRALVSLFPLVYLAVPLAIFTLPGYLGWPRWVTPVFLYSLTLLKTLASLTGVPQITLLNHRLAAPSQRAYVNGTTISVLALLRCLGPVVFGYLMSYGDSRSRGWLMWWVLAVIAGLGWVQLWWIEEPADD